MVLFKKKYYEKKRKGKKKHDFCVYPFHHNIQKNNTIKLFQAVYLNLRLTQSFKLGIHNNQLYTNQGPLQAAVIWGYYLPITTAAKLPDTIV